MYQLIKHTMAFALAVLATAIACHVVAAQQTPQNLRGVPRSLYAVYEGKEGKFTCVDKSATINIAQVNDDYCDCADGSDEVGTSACMNSRFYCVNKGYRGKYIASSYVNDGVCDCCDGSDEYSSRAKCANTCEADGAEWRKAQAAAIEKATQGAVKRVEYAAAGQEAAKNRKGKIADATTKLDAAAKAREAAEAEVNAAEAEEKKITEARRATALADGDGATAAELGITGMDRAALLNLLITHVKQTATSATLLENVKKLAAAGAIPGTATSFEPKWLENPAEMPDHKSEAGNAARAKLTEAKLEETKHRSDLDGLKDEDAADYGPDAAFFPLKGKCLDTRINQYGYSVCPFGRANQDGTSLGSFTGYKANADGTKNYSVMLFTGGQTCWNGPARSITVTFECGMEDKLLHVDEPEKCTYAARASSPAACDDRAARELKLDLGSDAGRDEL